MTVQRKQLAKGTKISIGPAGGSLTEYGRIETFTLPPEDYEEVEVPELNPQTDAGSPLAADPIELGDEIFGQATLTHYWDPRHADATQVDTWWAAKTELTIRLDTSHATGGARISFNGKIKSKTPAELTKKGYYKRTLVINRTSSITNIAIPAP